MTPRKIIRYVHLWLGLTSGLVVFILAVTGCIYAFQTEIQDLTQSYRFVQPADQAYIPPSRMRDLAEPLLPDKKIHSVLYGEKHRAAVVSFYNADPEYYYLVYVNPYTGAVLKVKDMSTDFFRIVLSGHYNLWLPVHIGQPVVASATLIFLVMIISGIVLWWPRNKAVSRQRFWFRWKLSTRWKRKNYDLHAVLGFYLSWILVFIVITGLVWGFQWFAGALYWTTSGGKTRVPYSETYSEASGNRSADASALDLLWRKACAENPHAETTEVHYPETPESAIGISVNPDASVYWKSDHRYYDQYSLKELPVQHMYGRYDASLSAADLIERMNYDIHTGAVLGLPGKILAFFASLVAASLPVTGFLIWRNRGRRYSERG
jgi:uncharacterized iron-regulated membrane protein